MVTGHSRCKGWAEENPINHIFHDIDLKIKCNRRAAMKATIKIQEKGATEMNTAIQNSETVTMEEDLKECKNGETSIIPVEKILLPENGVRTSVDDLVESMKMHGQLQCIGVVPVEDGSFKVVYGRRRRKAAEEAGLTEMRCKVFKEDSPELELEENIIRDDFTQIELAEAIKRLEVHTGLTQGALGLRLKKGRSTVNEYLKIATELSDEIRDSFRSNPCISKAVLLGIISLNDSPDNQRKYIEELQAYYAADQEGKMPPLPRNTQKPQSDKPFTLSTANRQVTKVASTLDSLLTKYQGEFVPTQNRKQFTKAKKDWEKLCEELKSVISTAQDALELVTTTPPSLESENAESAAPAPQQNGQIEEDHAD